MRASTSSTSETLVGLEHHRDRLADVAPHALALRALDEDAAAGPLRGPDQVRAREQAQPLAQGRPADAELGRELLLGAETLAGPQVARREVAADLERDLLAGIPPRRAEARVGHGANVASGATTTSSSSGSLAAGEAGKHLVERLPAARRGRAPSAPGSRTPARDRRRRPRSPATAPCRRPARRAGP